MGSTPCWTPESSGTPKAQKSTVKNLWFCSEFFAPKKWLRLKPQRASLKRLNLFLGKTFFKFLISFSNVKIIYSGKTKTTSHGFLHLPYSSSHFLRCIRFITPIRRKFRVGSGVGGEQTSWLAQLKYDLCGFLSKAVLGEKKQKQKNKNKPQVMRFSKHI